MKIKAPKTQSITSINEVSLLKNISKIIDSRKNRAGAFANDAAARNLGKRELRRQISRKAYERREIANAQLSEKSAVPFNVFKDPYLLDSLGLILCTKANRNQIELFELDKAGIAVTEYWTNLQPKTLLEEKINSIISEAQERLERRKLLGDGEGRKQIEYFFEPKVDEARE